MIVAFGVIGYILGKPVRDSQVEVPIGVFEPAGGD